VSGVTGSPDWWAATIRGQLRTLVGRGGGEEDLRELRAAAEGRLGPEHGVTLLVESALQQQLSCGRAVSDSVAAWAGLRQRAQHSLPEVDRVHMEVRSRHARFVRLRGRAEDLDDSVGLHRAEVGLRVAQLADDDHFLGAARADLAMALIDRVRTATRCGAPPGTADADLTEARQLIEDEVGRRSRLYGPAVWSTQKSRIMQCGVLNALAERDEQRRDERAARSCAIASELVDFFWEECGSRSRGLLASQLARAESLTLLGTPASAVRQARQACRMSVSVACQVDRGWPLYVLAVAMQPTDRPACLATAAGAIAARRRIFPRGSWRIQEVEQLAKAARA